MSVTSRLGAYVRRCGIALLAAVTTASCASQPLTIDDGRCTAANAAVSRQPSLVPNPPQSLRDLSFLIGRWKGVRPDGHQRLLEFVPDGGQIIVRMGLDATSFDQIEPWYAIHCEGGEIIASSLNWVPAAHVPDPKWRVGQFSAKRIGFSGFTWFQWERVGNSLLETNFVQEGDGFRRDTTILQKVR